MLRVHDVTHRYGATVALADVRFDVAAGEIVGVLGPNGAGKTTLFKLLSTYLEPQQGSLEIAGFDTRRAPLEVRARLGYLPEHNPLFDGMRVDRFLAFVGRAHGLAGAELAQRRAWVVGRCDLASVLTRSIRTCSKGFRQRIGLAAALIHDPPVLVLDEPTHGLDPLQVAAFRAFLHELRPGRAIVFSSHIVAEVAAISDRVLLLSEGRLILERSLRSRARESGPGAPAARERGADPVHEAALEELVLAALRDRGSPGTVDAPGGRT
jgi:ABC-2 type transport system ATP-binding protein